MRPTSNLGVFAKIAHWLAGVFNRRHDKPAAVAVEDLAELLEQIAAHKDDLQDALEKGATLADALAPWLGPQAHDAAKDLRLIKSLDKFRAAFAGGSSAGTAPPAPFV